MGEYFLTPVRLLFWNTWNMGNIINNIKWLNLIWNIGLHLSLPILDGCLPLSGGQEGGVDVGLDPALGDDDALRQMLQLLVMGQGQLDEPRGDATPLVAPGQ